MKQRNAALSAEITLLKETLPSGEASEAWKMRYEELSLKYAQLRESCEEMSFLSTVVSELEVKCDELMRQNEVLKESVKKSDTELAITNVNEAADIDTSVKQLYTVRKGDNENNEELMQRLEALQYVCENLSKEKLELKNMLQQANDAKAATEQNLQDLETFLSEMSESDRQNALTCKVTINKDTCSVESQTEPGEVLRDNVEEKINSSLISAENGFNKKEKSDEDLIAKLRALCERLEAEKISLERQLHSERGWPETEGAMLSDINDNDEDECVDDGDNNLQVIDDISNDKITEECSNKSFIVDESVVSDAKLSTSGKAKIGLFVSVEQEDSDFFASVDSAPNNFVASNNILHGGIKNNSSISASNGKGTTNLPHTSPPLSHSGTIKGSIQLSTYCKEEIFEGDGESRNSAITPVAKPQGSIRKKLGTEFGASVVEKVRPKLRVAASPDISSSQRTCCHGQDHSKSCGRDHSKPYGHDHLKPCGDKDLSKKNKKAPSNCCKLPDTHHKVVAGKEICPKAGLTEEELRSRDLLEKNKLTVVTKATPIRSTGKPKKSKEEEELKNLRVTKIKLEKELSFAKEELNAKTKEVVRLMNLVRDMSGRNLPAGAAELAQIKLQYEILVAEKQELCLKFDSEKELFQEELSRKEEARVSLHHQLMTVLNQSSDGTVISSSDSDTISKVKFDALRAAYEDLLAELHTAKSDQRESVLSISFEKDQSSDSKHKLGLPSPVYGRPHHSNESLAMPSISAAASGSSTPVFKMSPALKALSGGDLQVQYEILLREKFELCALLESRDAYIKSLQESISGSEQNTKMDTNENDFEAVQKENRFLRSIIASHKKGDEAVKTDNNPATAASGDQCVKESETIVLCDKLKAENLQLIKHLEVEKAKLSNVEKLLVEYQQDNELLKKRVAELESELHKMNVEKESLDEALEDCLSSKKVLYKKIETLEKTNKSSEKSEEDNNENSLADGENGKKRSCEIPKQQCCIRRKKTNCGENLSAADSNNQKSQSIVQNIQNCLGEKPDTLAKLPLGETTNIDMDHEKIVNFEINKEHQYMKDIKELKLALVLQEKDLMEKEKIIEQLKQMHTDSLLKQQYEKLTMECLHLKLVKKETELEIETLKEQNGKLCKDVAAKEKELVVLQGNCNNNLMETKQLMEGLSACELEISQLREYIDLGDREAKKLAKDLEIKDVEARNMEREILRLQSEIEQLQKMLARDSQLEESCDLPVIIQSLGESKEGYGLNRSFAIAKECTDVKATNNNNKDNAFDELLCEDLDRIFAEDNFESRLIDLRKDDMKQLCNEHYSEISRKDADIQSEFSVIASYCSLKKKFEELRREHSYLLKKSKLETKNEVVNVTMDTSMNLSITDLQEENIRLFQQKLALENKLIMLQGMINIKQDATCSLANEEQGSTSSPAYGETDAVNSPANEETMSCREIIGKKTNGNSGGIDKTVSTRSSTVKTEVLLGKKMEELAVANLRVQHLTRQCLAQQAKIDNLSAKLEQLQELSDRMQNNCDDIDYSYCLRSSVSLPDLVGSSLLLFDQESNAEIDNEAVTSFRLGFTDNCNDKYQQQSIANEIENLRKDLLETKKIYRHEQQLIKEIVDRDFSAETTATATWPNSVHNATIMERLNLLKYVNGVFLAERTKYKAEIEILIKKLISKLDMVFTYDSNVTDLEELNYSCQHTIEQLNEYIKWQQQISDELYLISRFSAQHANSNRANEINQRTDYVKHVMPSSRSSLTFISKLSQATSEPVLFVDSVSSHSTGDQRVVKMPWWSAPGKVEAAKLHCMDVELDDDFRKTCAERPVLLKCGCIALIEYGMKMKPKCRYHRTVDKLTADLASTAPVMHRNKSRTKAVRRLSYLI